MRPVLTFLRENPQAAILLAICVVLGLGTLIALAISTASGAGAGSSPVGAPDASVITLFSGGV